MPVRVSPVLIGRADLVALVDRRLGEVAAGRGHMLLISGEAGIGKSRLLAAVRDLAAGRGFAVVDAVAYPRDAEVAGGVLFDLAAALTRDPDTARTGAALTRRLRAGGSETDRHRRRRLLVGDLAEIVGGLAGAGRPRLIALEDLHWADDLTLEVLDRVAATLAASPALVAVTYRDDEPHAATRPWRARLLARRMAEEVRVPRLTRTETAELCAAIGAATPAREAAEVVHDRSDGVPLHVEELLGGDPSGAVPESLAEAIRGRAAALGPDARDIAAAASVIGRSFGLDLLAVVSGAPPDTIDSGVRELTDGFFVRPAPAGDAYDFRHALIRDALYADVPPLRRRELHARVAEHGAEFGDAFVSDHFERAARPAEAHAHAARAARDAVALSAHREAVELYRRAQRTTPGDTPPAERADLLADLGAELAAIDDAAGAARAYTDAIELWRSIGDDAAAADLVPRLVAVRHLLGAPLDERVALLSGALDATRDPAAVRAALAAAYMLARRLDEAVAHGEAARDLARDPVVGLDAAASLGSALVFAGRSDEGWTMLRDTVRAAVAAGDEAEAARGYRMIGSSASVLVEYDLAESWLVEGIAYAERAERFNDRHYMAAHHAHVRWAVGDWAAAESIARQALADGGGVTTRITAQHVLGYLAVGRGEFDAATARLTEAYELGSGMGELQRLSPAMWGLAEAALRAGRPDDAIVWCDRGREASAEVDDAAYLFPYVVTGVRAHLASGDPTGARDWLASVEEPLRRRGIPGTLPALDHAVGLLHLADGQTGKARVALDSASAAWDAAHRFWEGTQALADRARCATRSRRPAVAAELSAEAARRAGAAGATVLAPAAAPPPEPDPLTTRELEVARLVATGATNREIAEKLSVAPKTVAAHVEHILTKLGAARRAEIAAWVTRRLPRS